MTRNKLLYHKILPLGEFKTFSKKPDFEVVKTSQIHSDIIAAYKGRGLEEEQADGILFKYATLETKKISLAITTADCMPVLFLGKEKGVFLHAGWRGVAKGILSAPALKEVKPFYACIGPAISVDNFEVQEDFRQAFPEKEFYRQSGGKTFFDLKAKAQSEILALFPEISLEIAPECTMRLPKFHSHRRDGTKERNWNIFSL